MLKVLAIASQKGGSGKTTLAAHLAVAAAADGLSTCVVDTDPQGTLAEWWDAREADTPQLYKGAVSSLPAALKKLEGQGFGLVVIDTPPGTSKEVKGVLALADFVLIPAKPSPNDLRAIPGTLELLDGKPFGFALMQAIPRTGLVVQAMAALSEHGAVSPVIVSNRVDYATAMIDGRTMQEIDAKGKGAEEVASLWAWVRKKLGN